MNAQDVAKWISAQNPGVKYVVNATGTAVGAWCDELGRYYAVGDWLID